MEQSFPNSSDVKGDKVNSLSLTVRTRAFLCPSTFPLLLDRFPEIILLKSLHGQNRPPRFFANHIVSAAISVLKYEPTTYFKMFFSMLKKVMNFVLKGKK